MSKLLNDSSIATITSLTDSDYMNTVDPSTGEISKITVANVKASIGPLVYAAIISQSGSSAPTEDFVCINTTGKTFTWGRTSNGTYTLTASGAIFTGLTIVTFSTSTAAFGYIIQHAFTSSTVLTIYTRSLADAFSDGALNQAVIKIEQFV